MMSHNDDICVYSRSIEDLPEEILLRIFRSLLPYKDYASIRLVCRQWERLWRVIKSWRMNTFYDSLSLSTSSVSIHWHLIDPPAKFNLTPRFSHSVCYVDSKRMLYVFGGNRDMATSLNDFWSLDLSTRSWERILATGSYPPPKCSSTFIDDEQGNLILFGGRSMIYIDDIHMRKQLHNELHAYSLERNSWKLNVNFNEPGPICGHSASMVTVNNQKRMIIFGGCTLTNDQSQQATPQSTNDLWQWTDIQTNTWTMIHVDGIRPEPREGHSQFTLNSENILIVGGSSLTRVCRDVWMFSFQTNQWTQIAVNNQYPNDFAPSNDDLSYLPFCMISPSNILITFGRLKRHPTEHERHAYSQYDFSHCDKRSRDDVLTVSSSFPSSSSDENDERNRCSTTSKRSQLPYINNRYSMMDLSSGFQMYRLDLSNIFSSNPCVTWLPSKCTSVFGSPSHSSLYYSLIYTRSELILFGGIEKRKLNLRREFSDKDNRFRSKSSGTLAFITISNIAL
ncbi:unnamed protein product [Rotaria socialis]|uniref:F-box domain-containing protein n=1 Tax=Rotaria socialis TaxID=392032 RepID=A0A820PK83_9BILA|nr:unnamed protein product [Rotaria socialis]CAF3424478.1 unnamed protein product [Rotaria socialis]CAF4403865.1 unnamed protein product [Rotaria socialis]CAF4417278.1 unnamed protein product [Rotaria socialis]